ncbi:hypothetical protein SCALIN_C35_0029 [Candidatus Scalindua japonica]|uniref:Uncharacterized protein n=1 Tax=Candidatus Scalindua japonica TaxID=1284222 RepID=A0A286U369_9BACT|nr:hypothetical protein [Candidatus Scalindua japonica]GAX62590.1 hypothetical protein SCALIN_C35_0029 [Candidatus Scalindua japonica]
MEKIEGKVAKILDEYSIVINVGRNNGVVNGMVFAVFVQSDDEVKDPDSGESLGKLENVKEHLFVAHVQDKFSTCVAGEKETPCSEHGSHEAQTLSGAMMAESMTGRPESNKLSNEKLNVNTTQISGIPKSGPISVGDMVRAVEVGG